MRPIFPIRKVVNNVEVARLEHIAHRRGRKKPPPWAIVWKPSIIAKGFAGLGVNVHDFKPDAFEMRGYDAPGLVIHGGNIDHTPSREGQRSVSVMNAFGHDHGSEEQITTRNICHGI